mgnify:CR=1 FL=1
MKPAEAEAVPNLAIDPFDKVFLGDPYAYHDMIRKPARWYGSIAWAPLQWHATRR